MDLKLSKTSYWGPDDAQEGEVDVDKEFGVEPKGPVKWFGQDPPEQLLSEVFSGTPN